MRGSLVRRLAILLLVVSTALPASASPRRDDGSQLGVFERIIKIIRQILPLEDAKPAFPLP